MADFKDDIEKYRNGEMSSAERHSLEKKALSDPFLADALEGVESISPEDFSVDISEINQKLPFHRKKTIWLTPLRIAAGIILLIGGSFFIYTLSKPENQVALQKETTSSPNTSNADSTSKKTQPELLSLNKNEAIAELKTESGPTPSKTDGSGTIRPAADPTTSSQTINEARDQGLEAEPVAELSEIVAEEVDIRNEKIATAPVQMDLKKEAMKDDVVSRSQARKSKLAGDFQMPRIVSGQVTSAEDGLALPGVSVIVKGTTTGTVTDMQGDYSIPLEGNNQMLVFSFIGLQTSEVFPNDESKVNVKLLEDVSQLSEVVVMGYGFVRDENETPIIKLAEPLGGKKAYNNYLKSNLRYPSQALENKVKGKATIGFIVGTDGSLRDFSVVKSLGYGCDDEVIRLVKEGPKWSPSTEGNVAIDSKVRVKIKFDVQNGRK
ncbi:MAG: TonB family protein [Bacteroidia bacterium]|nr:TonB family protein [Bacteroidia bacterium]